MSRVWKYPLVIGRNVLSMPLGAKLLTIQAQGDAPTLWALVRPGEGIENRVIDIYGTGHMMPSDPGIFIATFQMLGGSLVWHAFDASLCDDSTTT